MGKLKKRKDGRYMKWVVLQDGTRKPVYAYSEPELNKKIKELSKQDEQGLILDDKTTVGEWGVRWFDAYKSALRGNTQSWYSNALNKHIIPVIGDIPLKDAKPTNVREVMNKISDYGEDLQHKVLITMKQMFRQAITDHLMIYDPCIKDIKIKKHTKPDGIHVLSDTEKDDLIAKVKGLRAELFVNLGLFCGLSREESLGLLWSGIDFKAHKLSVTRSTTFVVNQPDENHEVKEKARNRIIPIPDNLYKLLKIKKSSSKSIYVVPNAHNEEMTLSAFQRMWEPAAGAVDFRVTPHMLRHTYCTALIEGGLDIKTVQYLMGHSNPETTLKYYAFVRDKHLQSADKKVNEIFGCSQKSSQKRKKAK
jgi:integrase